MSLVILTACDPSRFLIADFEKDNSNKSSDISDKVSVKFFVGYERDYSLEVRLKKSLAVFPKQLLILISEDTVSYQAKISQKPIIEDEISIDKGQTISYDFIYMPDFESVKLNFNEFTSEEWAKDLTIELDLLYQ